MRHKRRHRSRLAARQRSGRRPLPAAVVRLVQRPVSQRWRERPRCPAPRVAPAAETGSFTPSLAVPHVAVCAACLSTKKRAARVPVCVVNFSGRSDPTNQSRTHWTIAANCFRTLRTIARAIATRHHRAFSLRRARRRQCSSLRFDPAGPGLRALTTPARGTTWAFARWPASDWLGRRPRSEVDAGFPQAYVDVIASVPHGTSSASHPVHAERVSSRRSSGTTPTPHGSPAG